MIGLSRPVKVLYDNYYVTLRKRNKLGEGAYGTVFKVSSRDNNEEYALKVLERFQDGCEIDKDDINEI